MFLSTGVPKPLSFYAPSARNEKQTYIPGNSGFDQKKKEGPQGFAADNQLNISFYYVTRVTGMIIYKEEGSPTSCSGVCTSAKK